MHDGDLGGVALGGGHGDLGTGPGVDDVIGQLGDGGAHHVDDGQDTGTSCLALLHGGDGVGGLAGLGDHHQQGVLIHQGVAVAQLGGQVGLHRDAAELLDDVLAHAAGIEGGAAGGDHDLVDLLQVLIGQGEVVQDDLPLVDAGLDGGLQGVGLLHDLLEHEVVIAALLCGGNVPGDAGDLHLDLLADGIVHGDAVGGDVCDLPVLQVDHVLGVGHQGGDVGREVVLPHAHAQDQRGGMAGGDQAALFILAEDAQGVGALQTGHGLFDSLHQVALVVQIQQVDDDLGVGLALEPEALGLQLLPQGGIVLDDAVVDDGELVVVAHMGVCVCIGGFPVGGPAGVTDAGCTGHGVTTLDLCVQVLDHADGFFHMDAVLSQNSDAGRVIASVLQLLQAIQQDGCCILGAGKADDTTHQRFLLFLCALFARS